MLFFGKVERRAHAGEVVSSEIILDPVKKRLTIGGDRVF
jgi:hypothetical protein